MLAALGMALGAGVGFALYLAACFRQLPGMGTVLMFEKRAR